MLKKLLKYDLKNIYKFLIIFYSLAIFFSILTRIFLNIESSLIMNIIGQICSGTTIAMFFNIIINNIMRLWVRFKNNLYNDESYLTHTLPIPKKTLYISKILTAIITLLTSTIVIIITLLIAYYSKDFITTIKNLLLPIANIYESSILSIILSFILVLFLEFSNILQCGFTGIILGHKMNNNKLGFSVLYGFITYIISQLILLLATFITALFNKDIMNLIHTTTQINIQSLKTVIYLAIILYTIILFIIYFLNINIFKKGVNIE